MRQNIPVLVTQQYLDEHLKGGRLLGFTPLGAHHNAGRPRLQEFEVAGYIVTVRKDAP